MQSISRSVILLSAAVLFSAAVPAFAESAPVFDADTMAQQFQSDSEQNQQDLPPPPAPVAANQDMGFVPAQEVAPHVTAPIKSSGSTDQRLKRLEQKINDLQGSEGNAHVESLQEQVQTLRGQLEQVTHQLQQMQAQQKTMYTDLDKRLSQPAAPIDNVAPAKKSLAQLNDAQKDVAPATPAPTKANAKITAKTVAPVPAAVAEQQPNVAEEQQIYQSAYNFIKAKKYNEAVDALQGMLKKYPSGQFASNAHYWLGELYGLLGKNDLALVEFGNVVKNYPESPRVSDAQLKVGLIYATQSKWPDAKASFKNVVTRHPGTASARVASDQLKQIKLAGH